VIFLFRLFRQLVTKEKKYKREIDRNKLGGKTEAEVKGRMQ